VRNGLKNAKRKFSQRTIFTSSSRSPEQIAAIAYQNKELVYGMLFRATAATLSTIAADPKHLGAAIGFLAVLHTWGQNLHQNPHPECLASSSP
jgi:hypothetical protein